MLKYFQRRVGITLLYDSIRNSLLKNIEQKCLKYWLDVLIDFFFLISVAVISTEAWIVKHDGETVTLQLKKSMIHPKHHLLTFLGDNSTTALTIISNGRVTINGTDFQGRLFLHTATGSITISNLSISDSGIFLAQVITATEILTQRFELTVLGE